MNFVKIGFFFVFTLLFQVSTDAQEWVSYQSPQQINDLVDTGNSLLLATDRGLVEVNKSTLAITILDNSNTSLDNNHIQSIARTADGTEWIGTYDGIIGKVTGAGFQNFEAPDSPFYNPGSTNLYDFEIAPNGDFWLGTTDGIFHRKGQDWLHYDQDELGSEFFKPWNIEINAAGDVFVASNFLYKFANGQWSNITEDTPLLNYLDADLFFSSTGDLYMSGDLDRIGRFNGQEWESFEHGLNGSQLKGFSEDTAGNIYVQTQFDGILKLVNDSWVPEGNAQNIDYFYIDEQNNQWLNNNINLSVTANGSEQSTLISSHLLESNFIDIVSKGANGNMYFVTAISDKISVLDPAGLWSFIPQPTLINNAEFLMDIHAKANDDIWLATVQGLYHYDGNDWTFNSLYLSRAIAEDSNGKIFVYTDNSIYSITNGEIALEYDVTNSPLTAELITGHGVDAADNLWIAEESINVIHKVSSAGEWTSYTQNDHPAIDRPKGDFHFAGNGDVWVPAALAGAIKFDGTSFNNPFISNLDLFDNYRAFSIESDASGKVYFSHQYGVTTLLNDEWEDLLIEEVPNINSSQRSKIKFDDAGTLWWGSNSQGLFSYTPVLSNTTNNYIDLSTDFKLYPNPAGSFTILDFVTSKNSLVNVFIYNNLGQLMTSLDLGRFSAGEHQQQINVAHLPKGFYSIQLKIDDQYSSKTMILQ